MESMKSLYTSQKHRQGTKMVLLAYNRGMINTKRTYVVLFLLFALSLGVGLFVLPQLPEQIVSHWNVSGEPDGYMTKTEGVLFFPLIIGILIAFYAAIPYIDPLRSNIERFRSAYNLLWILFSVFFFYIFCISLAWNLGYVFNFTFLIVPAFSFLLYGLGVLLGKAKRNWFVGIRTPWTLSSDVVWDKTHVLMGRLFKIAAFVSLFGMFTTERRWALAFTVIPLIAIVLFGVIYSFIEFKKKERGE